MAKRNFDNFITSYSEYAKDGFTPDEFHFWSSVSIIAGAMERKCWLPFNNGYKVFPNLYIFLVADPGIGKSAAGSKAVAQLLLKLDDMNFIPSQVTEAKLVDLMAISRSFPVEDEMHTQCAGYLFASEASNTLKEIPGGGDLKACFTDFYDCNDKWDKATKKDGRTTLRNICFNMLAGCTFEYLKVLIPEKEIRGGFASRVIYILHEDVTKRQPTWLSKNAQPKLDSQTRGKLLMDLEHIHGLSGPFSWDEDFNQIFLKDFEGFEVERIEGKDDNAKSLLARRHLNIMKLSMVLSVSEGDSMKLEPRHWEVAKSMLATAEKKYDKVLAISKSGGMEVQSSLNKSILNAIHQMPTANPSQIRAKLTMDGNDPSRVSNTINLLISGGVILTRQRQGQVCYQVADRLDFDL